MLYLTLIPPYEIQHAPHLPIVENCDPETPNLALGKAYVSRITTIDLAKGLVYPLVKTKKSTYLQPNGILEIL